MNEININNLNINDKNKKELVECLTEINIYKAQLDKAYQKLYELFDIDSEELKDIQYKKSKEILKIS